MMRKRLTNGLTMLIRDKEGRVVLFQRPNLPLLIGLGALAAAWPATGDAQHLLLAISFGALFTWSWLEITTGLSPARRLMGAGMLALLLALVA
ncbi:MAG TPA: hypothetical protein VD735_07295 [Candidatus Saccharimonadales bacterium]|nr:hypothetical protein [Candidatus Saccharimonadales bacterium]